MAIFRELSDGVLTVATTPLCLGTVANVVLPFQISYFRDFFTMEIFKNLEMI